MQATVVGSAVWSQQARDMAVVAVVVVRLRQVGREDRFSVSGATHVPPEVSNLLLSTRPTIYPTPPHTLSFLPMRRILSCVGRFNLIIRLDFCQWKIE